MTANSRSGTFLWFSKPDSRKASLVVETNTFLRTIAEGERRQFEYRSQSGRALKAWLILPLNYQQSKRYPLIVWARAGVVQGDVPPLLSNLNITMPSTQQTLQLLAAHGYAVLFPSMPMSDEKNKLVDLTDGVLPALDKVIEMGIADPQRLGVMGHSFGGSTTFGLITQTNRFQAAIAMAGRVENISSYGQFQPRKRYTDSPQEYLAGTMYIVESPLYGYGLEVPPWVDLERYVRNGPLFRIDRVETPVMIIHGDMDSSVPIEQGEEFFSGLYRQNKRARFVRYWGEGHQLESPANIRDMWKQIYDWFDEFLMNSDKSVTSSDK
jgi:dipeptidyl aminopeptidase/acylaminoacyl peptidase